MGKLHKSSTKSTFRRYVGFGQYEEHPTALCAGAKGVYQGKSYDITRLWKNVTCKHCLRHKPDGQGN